MWANVGNIQQHSRNVYQQRTSNVAHAHVCLRCSNVAKCEPTFLRIHATFTDNVQATLRVCTFVTLQQYCRRQSNVAMHSATFTQRSQTTCKQRAHMPICLRFSNVANVGQRFCAFSNIQATFANNGQATLSVCMFAYVL